MELSKITVQVLKLPIECYLNQLLTGWPQGNVNFADDEALQKIPAEFGEFGARIAGSDGLPWKKATGRPRNRKVTVKLPSDAAAEASRFHPSSFRTSTSHDIRLHSINSHDNLSSIGSLLGASSKKNGTSTASQPPDIVRGEHLSIKHKCSMIEIRQSTPQVLLIVNC